jgi:hypothetical protein
VNRNYGRISPKVEATFLYDFCHPISLTITKSTMTHQR